MILILSASVVLLKKSRMMSLTELAEKQVELLSEAFPDRKRLAVLWDTVSADQFKFAERRAKVLGLQVRS